MTKTSTTRFPIHSLLSERWSPRAFTDQNLTKEEVGSLLEAARWAPSCFNEQPWRFLVATRDDREGFERLGSCLMDGNAWAKEAAALIVTVARTTFERNDKPNRHAWHDVGLAAENLVLQAQALGLSTHQMAGFDADRAREVLGIPAGFEPVTMIAVGHRAEAETLPQGLAEREVAPRERRELGAIAFGSSWESPLASID